jgi:DNA-binding response OmpR family regulator
MRVLVIEDEEKMAEMIKRGLEEEGMEVDLAFDGEQGIAAGSTGRHDFIILDIGLPGRDGLEVARELRTAGLKTPLLMLTAHDTTEMKVKGLDSGADDYLTKPFAFAELLARLRALQRRTQTEEAPRLQIGDLALNLITRRVTRGGVEVQLTNKEFALLEYFMRHPRQVLSRDRIHDAVWGDTFFPESNVIDVHVKRLREKLEEASEPRLIQTIRGVGYSLRQATGGGRADRDSAR